ncbi:Late embryogenesis abundant protein D-29-like [Caenorhabditis elegans]|uniref:Late embryogenesis abundant protein D-29-like n=1 Tax=Caenorhabditis elegans TaxID=6239 RepID=O16281_CAEEL|nr:Late embryogenesis abundant protein D-29-like [Caenorhabditis elegans]CCD72096.1 Late embryogenesis abundant protein D-29-like [Caenorhabditis elegans]|eukprot:NP_503550.1 Uncharacterized protein CELE_F59A7.2 [Caenorhabditis elegans]
MLLNSLLYTTVIFALVWGYPGHHTDHLEGCPLNLTHLHENMTMEHPPRNETRTRRGLDNDIENAGESAVNSVENAGKSAWETAGELGDSGVHTVENAGASVKNGAENLFHEVEAAI